MAFDLSTARPVEDAPAGGFQPAAPASAGLQIPQQAQQRPRAVGVVETAMRTAAMAVEPVVRAIDMAAAGLAGIFGDTQGQAQIFGDMESRSRRMREQYAPAPGEEFSTVGQIGGGVLSMPIEVAGGMGLQRGVARASEVVERGGDLGQASLAGGVTAAANVAANLVPVRLGGAAGRAIEQTAASALQRLAPRLTPGAAATVGRVSGSAATGAGLGVAADVGATIAENSALPGDEAFDDLRRQADPATSAGFGAAFGAWGGRAARAAPAQRAPTPGTQGSAGAAATDMAAQRRARAASLPVPIELTEGQATRDFAKLRFEQETAKNSAAGEPLRQLDADQNQRLLQNLDALQDLTGARAASSYDAGSKVVQALAEKAGRAKARIDEAYAKAREAGETAEPVPYARILDYIEEQTPTTRDKLAPIIRAVEEQLQRNDPEGTGLVSIDALERVRQMVRANVEPGTPGGFHGGQLIQRIDAATEGAQGDLYRSARKLRAEYGRQFEDRAVVADLLETKKGTDDRKVRIERVVDSAVAKGKDDLQFLRGLLVNEGEAGRQAWREVQGAVLASLRDHALGAGSRDIRGNPVVSASKLAKRAEALDRDGKLEVLFDKRGAEMIRDLVDATRDLRTTPQGVVNTSHSASALRELFDQAITLGVSGLPARGVAVLAAIKKDVADRRLRKQVRAALPPGKSDGAPRTDLDGIFEVRPGVDDAAPAANAAAGARGTQAAAADAAAVPADPRLQEIARLKAEQAGSPETIRVLDAQAKRIRAELQAGRAAKTRETEADALERAAGSTFEIAVRQALLARARELRGAERIPAGEARELPAGAATPKPEKAPASIPAGDARELTAEQARRAEPTRRERELLNLRAEATSPDVVADLDRAIQAERRRVADAERGAEYLRLADRATDPGLRQQLEAKARKLGAEREPLPVGEARELDVELERRDQEPEQ